MSLILFIPLPFLSLCTAHHPPFSVKSTPLLFSQSSFLAPVICRPLLWITLLDAGFPSFLISGVTLGYKLRSKDLELGNTPEREYVVLVFLGYLIQYIFQLHSPACNFYDFIFITTK